MHSKYPHIQSSRDSLMHSLQSSPVLIDSPRSERVYLFIACQALLKKGYTRPDSSPYLNVSSQEMTRLHRR